MGATAIFVSNHGGNNLDGTLAAIRLLPSVVDPAGDELEILLDGGIRRGSDVVKALALGARSVMCGRAVLWDWPQGDRPASGTCSRSSAAIDEALAGLGRSSVHELLADDVLVPPGFACGADRPSLRGGGGHVTPSAEERASADDQLPVATGRDTWQQ